MITLDILGSFFSLRKRYKCFSDMCEMYHGVFCAKDNRDAINESENNDSHTSQNPMTSISIELWLNRSVKAMGVELCFAQNRSVKMWIKGYPVSTGYI